MEWCFEEGMSNRHKACRIGMGTQHPSLRFIKSYSTTGKASGMDIWTMSCRCRGLSPYQLYADYSLNDLMTFNHRGTVHEYASELIIIIRLGCLNGGLGGRGGGGGCEECVINANYVHVTQINCFKHSFL